MIGSLRNASLPAAVAMILWASPASAKVEPAEEEVSTTDVSLSLSAVSDYRYRGLSLSNKKPALQGEVAVSHETGIYGRLWGSTIADNGGADIETQGTFGYYAEIGIFNADVQAAYYVYPGASADNYGEVSVRLGSQIGPAEIGTIVSYAPAQRGTGDLDNLYIGVDGRLPLFDDSIALAGSFGMEDGAFGDDKLDWSFGLIGEKAGLSLSLMYVDTSRTVGDPLGEPTIVASIGGAF